mmetsp:Transcript_19833/g.56299  ORF Transcript_19833/g.56299 Transcript_19833/m.56299 type:complete len:225 (+) Transcript_19833:41-715(+)
MPDPRLGEHAPSCSDLQGEHAGVGQVLHRLGRGRPARAALLLPGLRDLVVPGHGRRLAAARVAAHGRQPHLRGAAAQLCLRGPAGRLAAGEAVGVGLAGRVVAALRAVVEDLQDLLVARPLESAGEKSFGLLWFDLGLGGLRLHLRRLTGRPALALCVRAAQVPPPEHRDHEHTEHGHGTGTQAGDEEEHPLVQGVDATDGGVVVHGHRGVGRCERGTRLRGRC